MPDEHENELRLDPNTDPKGNRMLPTHQGGWNGD